MRLLADNSENGYIIIPRVVPNRNAIKSVWVYSIGNFPFLFFLSR